MRIVRVRAIIRHEGKCLFVKHLPDSSFWALPGGHLEDGETLEAGIRREIIEELGIEPRIGKILYVHQLFKADTESLEFFFEVLNGKDYLTLDLSQTTHGLLELASAEFIDPAGAFVLPAFLAELERDIAQADWPKLLVHTAQDA